MLVVGVGYVVLVVLGVVAAAIMRWRYGHDGLAAQPDTLQRPGDVAFLRGGNRSTVMAAVAALRVDGLVEGSYGSLLTSLGRLEAGRDPVERAVHAAGLRAPVRLSALTRHLMVGIELEEVRARVEQAGLLDRPGPPRKVSLSWWVPVALLAVGGVIGVLAGMVLGVSAVTVVVAATGAAAAAAALSRVPRPGARRARAELARLRDEYGYLAPSMSPSWPTYGAHGAAMAVALYGDVALRQADPVFATAILGSHTDDAEPPRGWRPFRGDGRPAGRVPLRSDGSEPGGYTTGIPGGGGGGGCGGGP